MNRWLKKTLIGVFGLSLLAGALSGCCRNQASDWTAEDTAQIRNKVADRLDLNTPQRQKLTALFDQLQTLHSSIKGQTTDPRAELAALLSGAKFDRTRAQTLLDEKTTAMQANGPQLINAFADFYDSLNAEQQQTVREKLERRKGWFWH